MAGDTKVVLELQGVVAEVVRRAVEAVHIQGKAKADAGVIDKEENASSKN